MKILNMAMVAALVLGQAAYGSVITYSAILLGTSEVPPTGSPGTGQATVIINTLAPTMEVQVTFSGLGGTTTASHIIFTAARQAREPEVRVLPPPPLHS